MPRRVGAGGSKIRPGDGIRWIDGIRRWERAPPVNNFLFRPAALCAIQCSAKQRARVQSTGHETLGRGVRTNVLRGLTPDRSRSTGASIQSRLAGAPVSIVPLLRHFFSGPGRGVGEHTPPACWTSGLPRPRCERSNVHSDRPLFSGLARHPGRWVGGSARRCGGSLSEVTLSTAQLANRLHRKRGLQLGLSWQ